MKERKPLGHFLEECQLFATIGDFVVLPDVMIEPGGNPVLVFKFYLEEREGDCIITDISEEIPPDSIIYEKFTPENIRLAVVLYPDFREIL